MGDGEDVFLASLFNIKLMAMPYCKATMKRVSIPGIRNFDVILS